jgi:hypothetical protein
MTAAPLLEFRRPPPFIPPGASPLLAVVLLAIETAASIEDLHAWSSEHDDVPHLLSPAERRIAIAALHRREATLG